MKGSKFWEKNSLNGPFTHGSTGTSKCGTDTKSVLPFFSGLVPVPISVVPVPLSYYHFFLALVPILIFSGTGTTLQKFP